MSNQKLNENFWDCECEHNCIRFRNVRYCPYCKTFQDNQPDSHDNEVHDKYRGQGTIKFGAYKGFILWYTRHSDHDGGHDTFCFSKVGGAGIDTSPYYHNLIDKINKL